MSYTYVIVIVIVIVVIVYRNVINCFVYLIVLCLISLYGVTINAVLLITMLN